MTHKTFTLAAAIIATGFASLGGPHAVSAMEMDRGPLDHRHDMEHLRHPHHHHRDGTNDGFVNWCYQHPRLYDPRTGTYIGADGYRHYCESPIAY